MQNIISALISLRQGATDEQALEAVALYPAWKHGTAYHTDERIRHNDTLYRCVQPHTSQPDWTPDTTPALWTRISLDEWPEWVQPTGQQDAYSIGDKITYNGRRYISTIDNNVWSPDTYPAGWEAR